MNSAKLGKTRQNSAKLGEEKKTRRGKREGRAQIFYDPSGSKNDPSGSKNDPSGSKNDPSGSKTDPSGSSLGFMLIRPDHLNLALFVDG